MKRLRLRFAKILVFAAICTAPSFTKASEVLAVHFKSPTLGRDWNYDIYLPPGYDQSTSRYPVVYLLHGVADDETSWIAKAGLDQIADRMIETHEMSPCIIVMPAGKLSWYVNGPEPMEAALITDLLPEVDHLYRTRADRRSRTIAGVSMGGFGALRLALLYPDRFSAVALMSPAIYTPDPPVNSAARRAPAFLAGGNFDPERWHRMNYPSLLDTYQQSSYRLRVRVSAGLQDPLDTGTASQRFVTTWQQHGWSASLVLQPGKHDYALWKATLPPTLRFLVNPSGPPPALAHR